MNEVAFRNWMVSIGKNKKLISDTISRLKKVEHELGNIDIDVEYRNDLCESLLRLFDNTGRNEKMEKLNPNLPIGKYQLSAYKYAVKLYILYSKNITQSFDSNAFKS